MKEQEDTAERTEKKDVKGAGDAGYPKTFSRKLTVTSSYRFGATM